MKRCAWLFWLTLGAGCLQAQSGALRAWNDYQVIMWMSGKTVADKAKAPLVVKRLREMGVTAGMVTGEGDASMWTNAKMPYYVENIVRTGLCLKFRSPVSDWGKFVNQWMETRDESAFVRPYCLEDPAWLAESRKQMQKVAGLHKANAPLLYDIRDELSTTISANPFDYDFSPQSLAGFRKWLQTDYVTLEALNKQWDTDFASWEAVRPFSTDQIKRRMVTGERMPKGPPDDWSALRRVKFDPVEAAKEPVKWNFSPWCDFRSYMDTVLARTLDSLRQAAREVDPATPVGVEGTQMPHAFGGYDLWKLSQSVDWLEPYDVANSREILGDFMPGKRLFCTLFEKDAERAMRRLWHLLLLGDKGCIVWWSEDCIDESKPDFPLTEKGKALAPVFRELQSPLAKLFMVAERETDPIAIHYSQASIQVAWLLESVADGKTWPRRFSSFESGNSRHAAVRNGWLKLLQDMGYTPKFVSVEQLRNEQLTKNTWRLIVFPDSIAADTATWSIAAALADWTAPASQHCAVTSSGSFAAFDEHGKLRGRELFAEDAPLEAWGPGRTGFMCRAIGSDKYADSVDLALYAGKRASGAGGSSQYLLRDVTPRLPVLVPAELCIRTHRYRLGVGTRLLAFERGVDYHMSEDLKQAGGNESLEKPITFTAKLSEKAHVYNLRSGAYLGERDDIAVDLNPWKPSLFVLLAEKLPEGKRVVETLLQLAPAKAR